MKKLLALLLALVMVLSLCACGGKSKKDEEKESSYTDPLDALIAVSYEGKSNKIKSLAPSAYWDWYEEEYGETVEDLIEDYKESWEYRKEMYAEEFGDNFKVTYKVAEKEEIDEETLEGIATNLEEEYGITSSVKAGYDVTLEMTMKGSEDEDEAETEMAVIQIGDDWYAIHYYDYGYGECYVSFPIG